MRWLLIRPGALGDLLLTIPAIEAIRGADGTARIEVWARGEGRTLLGLPLVDATDRIDSAGFAPLFGEGALPGSLAARLARFDACVAWLPDEDGRLLRNLRAAGIARVEVFDPLAAVRAAEAGTRPKRHVTEILQEPLDRLGAFEAVSGVERPLERLGVAPRHGTPAPALPAEERSVGRGTACRAPTARTEDPRPLARHQARIPSPPSSSRIPGIRESAPQAGRPWVGIHPGAGSESKCAPAALFAAVARGVRERLGGTPVFIEGPDPIDGKALGRVLATSDIPFRVLSPGPLPEFAAFLRTLDAYVGNDSGATHLSALLGVPTTALFGPTDPAVWGPVGERVRCLGGPPSGFAGIEPGDVWVP
ncbi:MAG: glycosyltransferase family 9 protein [Planctomycetota bacterium]